MPSNQSWGEICGAAAIVAALPFAVAAGTISVLNGQTFDEGGNPVLQGFEDLATRFGEKHGQLIEKTLVKATVWIVIGGICDIDADDFSERPPKGPDV